MKRLLFACLCVAGMLAFAPRGLAQQLVDPASGKVIADLSAMEKQAQEYEAAGNREAAMKIRAQMAEMKKRVEAMGNQPPRPAAGQDPKLQAMVKELLEKEASLRAAGKVEQANEVRERILKLQAEMKVGGSAGPVGPVAPVNVVDKSADLELTAAAPKGVTVAQPIKLTVALAIRPSGPMTMPLPALKENCLTDAGNPKVSFEIWHEDKQPVNRLPVAAVSPKVSPPKPDEKPAEIPDKLRPDAPVAPKGEAAPVPSGGVQPPAGQPAAIALKRGEKAVLSDSPFFKPLNEIYSIDRPGTYTFQVRYEHEPEATSSVKARIKLISDPVTLEVGK